MSEITILRRMKTKISVTLSPEILAGLDRVGGSKQSRSALIESILRDYCSRPDRLELQARDLERLNRSAERLNSEAADVREYQ